MITLDVAMPRLDGFSAAATLRTRADTSHIPIVMVTARAQGSDLSRGAELGVAAYVTKPFDPDNLVDVVRSVAAGETPGQPRYDGSVTPEQLSASIVAALTALVERGEP